jgi:hypothetical protein
MRRVIKGLLLLLPLSLAVGGIACGGEPDDASGGYGALIEYVIPERLIPESVWQMAPPSCDGILRDDMIHISHAENAPSLGVVIDEDGEPICVDTWDAIHIELSRVKGDPSPDPMRPIMIPLTSGD